MFVTVKNKWRQILTTECASYLMICVGMSMVWTSPVLRELHGPHSPLEREPTMQEEEWIASLILLGGVFSPLLTYPLTKYVGRRTIIMTMNIPLLMGWTLAGLATNMYCLYAARFFWGCAMGTSFMIVPVYIGEIAEDSIRGALGAIYALNLNMGMFLGFLVGRFANYWAINTVGGVLSLFFLILSWSLPETPFYLVYKGRSAEALAVLQKLRGAPEEVVSCELKVLENMVEREYREKTSISDLWATKGNLKALAICVFLSMMIQLVGFNVILFYLEELFAKVHTKMSSADAPIVIGAVQTALSSITPLLVERLGRRLLLYSTNCVMSISLDSIRGALGAIYALNLNMGMFLGFLVGRFANYWAINTVGGVLSLFFLILSWSLPETPFYLVYKGRSAEALAVLQKLRGAPEEVVSCELKVLENMVEREYREKTSISDLWATKGNLKALAICVFLSMMIQLVGFNVILFYLEELFAKVHTKMSSADAPIVIGAVQTASSSITPLLVERLGRRLLLYSTNCVMSISLIIIGIYSLLESYYHVDVSSVTYLPLVCLIVYIIFFTWGAGPIPLILVSEMFPARIKCLAAAICASMCWFSGFILLRFYSDLTAAAGTYCGFWTLSLFCAVGGVFSFFVLMETKGKSFGEIQDILNNRTPEKKSHNNNVLHIS